MGEVERSNTAAPQSPLIGASKEYRTVLNLAARYARYDITLLITGETGTGKDVLARYIHNRSARSDKPFVQKNVTTIPETLVESELFGYVRGAFSGADRQKPGLIEAADKGTLFLDEVGDLPLGVQVKLLRVLESKTFYKLGSTTARSADVRIVAATNKDLTKAIRDGKFREDLYYRLASARMTIPPLRNRLEDIVPLSEYFILESSRRFEKPPVKISSSVQALFKRYAWPGNVRELKNTVESAFVIAEGEHLTVADLPMDLQQFAAGHSAEITREAMSHAGNVEHRVLRHALQQARGDKLKAAQLLGISTRTLYRKLEKMKFMDLESAETMAPLFLPREAPSLLIK